MNITDVEVFNPLLYSKTVAKVWIVDQTRGDLYVVARPHRDEFVRLVDGGIANHLEEVLNCELIVLVNQHDDVVALPSVDGCGRWSRCVRVMG
jgi:hypothetical protein